MKMYNVGYIVENDSNDLSRIKLITYYYLDRINDSDCSNEDLIYLKSNITEYKGDIKGIKDNKIIKILSNVSFMLPTKLKIIYELITDQDGNLYAKELLTGLLFPFSKEDTTNRFYYDIYNDGKLIRNLEDVNNNMARTKYSVVFNQVASKNVIDEYKRKRLLRKKIKNFYNENVFKNKIVEKKEKTLEKQNEYTKLMEDIELLLQLLKKQNPKMHSRLKEEYKKIKNGKDDTLVAIEPTIEDFKFLFYKIKLNLMIEKDFKDLPSYLLSSIENYFIKMVTNELNDIDLSINDLDNITEMFLISKDDYDIKMQRHILKEISMLYLFVVKSNINNININKLNESYFKDNIKTILLHILALNEMEIIKNIPTINFDDNITVENIFNIIKEIEFHKADKEKVKNLIK